MKRIIPLKEEFVLREAFGREIVRKQFVSDVTGVPMEEIKSVTMSSNFLRKAKRKAKQGILDFVMTLNNDVKINVELQVRRQKYWIKRNLFYLSHLYLDELFVGENYGKLKRCVAISILDFNLLEDREENHSVFMLRDADGRNLTDLFEVHVIELRKKPAGQAVDDWIGLFNAETEEDLKEFQGKREGIREAAEAMKIASMARDVKWYFWQLQKARRDRWAEDEYVRDEGRAEGKAEDIMELLERFGEVPEDIRVQIYGTKDLEELRRLHKLAASAESLNEFCEELNR